MGPLIALILLMIIGALTSGIFLGAENLSNVFTRSAIIGIIAIGATFVITAGGLDLSVGSLSALVAGVTILFLNHSVGALGSGWLLISAGILFSILVGAAAGFLNGYMIVKGRVEAFIVTLGAMGIFRSIITWLSDGGSISLDFSLRDAARPIYYGQVGGIAVPIIVLIVMAVIGEVVLRRVRFGRHVAAISSNRHVALYSAMTKGALSGRNWISHRVENLDLVTVVKEYDIRAGNYNATAGSLSGGNQQKILIAKTLATDPDLVVFDEPTRGVDIGAKQQIYEIIARLADAGKAIVVISSEMQEIVGLSDRVVVMRRGQISGELTGEKIQESEIIRFAMGLQEELTHV